MTDYEKYYQNNRHALGEPTEAFVEFFASYAVQNARVLDVGCGQGRDALFIARLGHRVEGVDASPSGVRDMISDGKKEGLPILGEVADIRNYAPKGEFDIVLIDRTLHMLREADRLEVLRRLLDHVKASGHLLIADEPSNMAGFRQVLEASKMDWKITNQKKGYLFAQKVG